MQNQLSWTSVGPLLKLSFFMWEESCSELSRFVVFLLTRGWTKYSLIFCLEQPEQSLSSRTIASSSISPRKKLQACWKQICSRPWMKRQAIWMCLTFDFFWIFLWIWSLSTISCKSHCKTHSQGQWFSLPDTHQIYFKQLYSLLWARHGKCSSSSMVMDVSFVAELYHTQLFIKLR